MHTALQNCPVAAPTLQALARMPLSCTAQHVALTACQLTMRAMRHRCCQGHALATTLPGRVMQRATMRTNTSCVGNYTSPAQGPHVPSASARTRARLRRAAPRRGRPGRPRHRLSSSPRMLARKVRMRGRCASDASSTQAWHVASTSGLRRRKWPRTTSSKPAGGLRSICQMAQCMVCSLRAARAAGVGEPHAEAPAHTCARYRAEGD